MDKPFIRHELKTPIGAIRGYLSMLKEGDFGNLNLTKEQNEIFAKVDNDLLELIKKIDTLLSD
jgi:signal transduction histidine kinase